MRCDHVVSNFKPCVWLCSCHYFVYFMVLTITISRIKYISGKNVCFIQFENVSKCTWHIVKNDLLWNDKKKRKKNLRLPWPFHSNTSCKIMHTFIWMTIHVWLRYHKKCFTIFYINYCICFTNTIKNEKKEQHATNLQTSGGMKHRARFYQWYINTYVHNHY